MRAGSVLFLATRFARKADTAATPALQRRHNRAGSVNPSFTIALQHGLALD
jgi:hypothetical protein